jgi:branched-subunit amino acid transport protein
MEGEGEESRMRMEILLLILGMMLVTYVPRLIPFVLLRAERIPERWRSLLGHIPHAALGALLIPGCINGVAGNPTASVAGILAAGLVLWFKPNILLAMLAAVAAAWPFASN